MELHGDRVTVVVAAAQGLERLRLRSVVGVVRRWTVSATSYRFVLFPVVTVALRRGSPTSTSTPRRLPAPSSSSLVFGSAPCRREPDVPRALTVGGTSHAASRRGPPEVGAALRHAKGRSAVAELGDRGRMMVPMTATADRSGGNR